MTLTILTAVCGALDVTAQWFAETIGNCRTHPQVVVVSNGNTEDEVAQLRSLIPDPGSLVEAPEPLGSTRAFNLGLPYCTGDVVAMLHNDLLVKQEGWDARVLGFFEASPQTGVCGFHGSQLLGHPALYKIPYELHQLARGGNFSNLEDAEAHGSRTDQITEVVTLDGMALIARRKDLLAWGGFDERYQMHMYDHDLCTTARQHGKSCHLIPISAKHVSGQTATYPRWNEHLHANGFANGDSDIHRLSHEAFYAKWRGSGLLPARIT